MNIQSSNKQISAEHIYNFNFENLTVSSVYLEYRKMFQDSFENIFVYLVDLVDL